MARPDLEDYVDVATRIQRFSDKEQRTLVARIVADDGKRIVMEATASFVESGVLNLGVGHAEEIRGAGMVNKTSALENCETSAWGRALAALGFETTKGIASKQEMEKVQRMTAGPVKEKDSSKGPNKPKAITLDQLVKIQDRINAAKVDETKLGIGLAAVGAETLQTCTPAQAKQLLEAVGA